MALGRAIGNTDTQDSPRTTRTHKTHHGQHGHTRLTTDNTDTQDSPRATRTHKTHHGPNLGEATTFPLIVYFVPLHGDGGFPLIVYSVPLHGACIQMAFLSRDSRMGVPKSCQWGLPGLWSPITLRADLGSKCGLKQSCSSHRELSNGMCHVVCSQVNRVDSRLLVVGSQTVNLTPGLSFAHNLCFKYPNEPCEPILDIYTSIAFQ